MSAASQPARGVISSISESARGAETARRLERYWPRGAERITSLPLPETSDSRARELPPRLETIELPQWAADIAVSGSLLVPAHCVAGGPDAPWMRVDWLAAADWFLHGTAEKEFEKRHGPIHSYSYRLRGWDSRMWERAWINRIALFLRRWASIANSRSEDELFGPRPAAEIVVTHDVDAVCKTSAIRIKQSAFRAFQSLRRLGGGEVAAALRKSTDALRFLLQHENYWFFDRITALEDRFGIRSHFNFYAGAGGWRRGPKAMLFDPGYDVRTPRIRAELHRLSAGGWTIGLHHSHDAWSDADRMREEREYLEQAVGAPVTSCRQHWLRFSWSSTWRAQREAGLQLDTTMAFNDRPGFRNSAALPLRPFGLTTKFEALPTVLMDSHFFDYAQMTDEERPARMASWIDEIRAVGGVAAVLWHQQVMGRDYGWGDGYVELLRIIANDSRR